MLLGARLSIGWSTFFLQKNFSDSSNGFHLIKKEALICWHIPLWEHLWAFRLDFGNHPKNPISERVIKYWNTSKYIYSTILKWYESSNILDQDCNVIFKVVEFNDISKSKLSRSKDNLKLGPEGPQNFCGTFAFLHKS